MITNHLDALEQQGWPSGFSCLADSLLGSRPESDASTEDLLAIWSQSEIFYMVRHGNKAAIMEALSNKLEGENVELYKVLLNPRNFGSMLPALIALLDQFRSDYRSIIGE